MHGLLTGNETRQQAYTMLTRGRHANHAYLVVVGDGDPHTTIRPEVVNPLTPTDILDTHPGPRRIPDLGHHPTPRRRQPRRAA